MMDGVATKPGAAAPVEEAREASKAQAVARDCRTCGLLRPTRHAPLDEHYMACGWQPCVWPANALILEEAALRAHEHSRLVPKKTLGEMAHLLRPCPAWEARMGDAAEGPGA